MLTLPKKIFLVLATFCILFTNFAVFLPSRPLAQETGTWYNQSFPDWYNKVYDEKNPSEIFGERYTAAQVQWVIYSILSYLINAPLGNNSESQAVVRCFLTSAGDVGTCVEALNKFIPQLKGTGFIQTKNNKGIASLIFEERSLSGTSYFKQKLNRFHLIPEVSAQTSPGFGFSVLEPVQKMWKGMRDISFGLFVVAALAVSFMIMFRVKINPQTVITVQSAIPKLIVALILVSFSYAIAGLMIDLMYVFIGLVSLLAPNLTVFDVEPSLFFGFLTKSNILIVLGVYMFFFVISFIGSVAAMMGAPLFATLSGVFLAFFWWIIIILVVVLIIVCLWISFKTLWALLKAFANILLSVIFGPIQIVLGVVIPNMGFGAWLKNLLANLSVFVVTGILILFSIVFLVNGVMLGLEEFFGGVPGSPSLGATILHFFIGDIVPNAITGQVTPGWPPFLGGGDSKAVVGLMFLGVSFVLFTLIPKATEIVQGFISGKPFAYGTALNDAATPLSTFWGYTGGAYLRDAERNSKFVEGIWDKVKAASKRQFGQERSGGQARRDPRHQDLVS